MPAWSCSSGAGASAAPRSTPCVVSRRPVEAVISLSGGGTTTVEAARYPGPAEEAEANARLLRVAHERDGVPYGRMAILLPSARRLSAPTRRALERFGVPYRLGAGERQLVAEPIVGHVLDLFRLGLDPAGRRAAPVPAHLAPRRPRRASYVPSAGPPSWPTAPWPTTSAPEPSRHPFRKRRPRPLTGPWTGPGDLAAGERGANGPVRAGSALVLDPGLVARVQALCDLIERAERWVAELDADAFWEVWRSAPAFSELILRAEVDPTDADVQRQLDALTAFSRALSLFVDGRPGAACVPTWTWSSGPTSPAIPGCPRRWPGTARSPCCRSTPPRARSSTWSSWPGAWRAPCLDGPPAGAVRSLAAGRRPGPVARADAVLDAERRRFTLAASRARDRVVLTASRVDGRGEPSRFLRELGLELPAEPPALDTNPLGSLEAAGALRRVAGDRDRPAAERLAAATTLAALPGVDPATWWWRRDYTVDPEPIATEGRLRTSYSRIGTYEDCHLKYFFGSVAGLDDRSSYQMAFGRLMHTIFELAAKGDVRDDPEDLKAAYRKRFNPGWTPTRAIAYQYWRDGMGMLELWHREAEVARRALRFESEFEWRSRTTWSGAASTRSTPARRTASSSSTTRPPGTRRPGRRPSGPPARHLLPAALRDPELAASAARSRCSSSTRPGSWLAGSPGSSQHPGPDHANRSSSGCSPSSTGRRPSPLRPRPARRLPHVPLQAHLCPMWPQGEEFLAPALPSGLSPPAPPPPARRPGTGVAER